MAKEKSIGFYIKNHPPLTITMITSAILLLQSSKGMLIDNIPVKNKELIEALSGWYTYILDASGAIFAVLCILLGVKPDDKPDTDHPNKP